MRILDIFWVLTRPLPGVMFSVGCLFTFLMVSFEATKFQILMMSISSVSVVAAATTVVIVVSRKVFFFLN